MNTSGTTHKGLTQASRFAPLAVITLALTLVASEGKAQEPRPGAAKTAQGRVESFTTALMGEVDGATLDDGTVVHWPPHLADRFTAILAKGDRVRVSGRMETGPAGDTHFEAETATNIRTNASTSSELAGRPPLPGPGRVTPGGSDDFVQAPDSPQDVQRRLKSLEDQISQLREEVRRLRREP
jgi:hypothetical protein